MLGSHKLTWSLSVHPRITSLSVLLSSVNFDGVFPQLQKLEKLVFRPLLQGHQGSCFLLQILIYGKNDLGSLLCFLVPRVSEEPLQGFLVDVFKDVAHSFLTWGCVKVVAVDGRADPQRGGHGDGLMAWLCFHRCGLLENSAPRLSRESVAKSFRDCYLKLEQKLRAQITLVTSEWSQGRIITDKFNSWVANILLLGKMLPKSVFSDGEWRWWFLFASSVATGFERLGPFFKKQLKPGKCKNIHGVAETRTIFPNSCNKSSANTGTFQLTEKLLKCSPNICALWILLPMATSELLRESSAKDLLRLIAVGWWFTYKTLMWRAA